MRQGINKTISIPVNESYTDQAGVRQTKVQWFKIEAWKGLANFLGTYGKKGTAFLIEGRLKNESYEKKGKTQIISWFDRNLSLDII